MDDDCENAPPWRIGDFERHNARVFVSVDRKNREDDADILLAVLTEKFNATITGQPFSPYDARYGIRVNGTELLLIHDSLAGICLVAQASDEVGFFELIHKLCFVS